MNHPLTTSRARLVPTSRQPHGLPPKNGCIKSSLYEEKPCGKLAHFLSMKDNTKDRALQAKSRQSVRKNERSTRRSSILNSLDLFLDGVGENGSVAETIATEYEASFSSGLTSLESASLASSHQQPQACAGHMPPRHMPPRPTIQGTTEESPARGCYQRRGSVTKYSLEAGCTTGALDPEENERLRPSNEYLPPRSPSPLQRSMVSPSQMKERVFQTTKTTESSNKVGGGTHGAASDLTSSLTSMRQRLGARAESQQWDNIQGSHSRNDTSLGTIDQRPSLAQVDTTTIRRQGCGRELDNDLGTEDRADGRSEVGPVQTIDETPIPMMRSRGQTVSPAPVQDDAGSCASNHSRTRTPPQNSITKFSLLQENPELLITPSLRLEDGDAEAGNDAGSCASSHRKRTPRRNSITKFSLQQESPQRFISPSLSFEDGNAEVVNDAGSCASSHRKGTPRRNSITKFSLRQESPKFVISPSLSFEDSDGDSSRRATAQRTSSLSALSKDGSMPGLDSESCGEGYASSTQRGRRSSNVGVSGTLPSNRKAYSLARAMSLLSHKDNPTHIQADDHGSVASGQSDGSRLRHQRRGSVTQYSMGCALAKLDEAANASKAIRKKQNRHQNDDDRSAVSEQLPPRPGRFSSGTNKGPISNVTSRRRLSLSPDVASYYAPSSKTSQETGGGRSVASEQSPSCQRYHRRGPATKYSLEESLATVDRRSPSFVSDADVHSHREDDRSAFSGQLPLGPDRHRASTSTGGGRSDSVDKTVNGIGWRHFTSRRDDTSCSSAASNTDTASHGRGDRTRYARRGSVTKYNLEV